MDIFLCIMIFMMGTMFGSFFTLAVYRIPLKKDITHERSFCPNCNHRLEFLDLIPILSYICLAGKCRYCGQKIRIRYLLLEVLSGLVFVTAFLSLNIRFPFYDINKFIYFISFVCIYITLAITIGIDSDKKSIHLGVILFGVISQIVYIVYLYILDANLNIYRYGIYILIFAILCLFRKNAKNKYLIENLIIISFIILFLPIKYLIITIGSAGIIYCLIKIINRFSKINRKEFNFATLLSISAIVVEIIKNYTMYY